MTQSIYNGVAEQTLVWNDDGIWQGAVDYCAMTFARLTI